MKKDIKEYAKQGDQCDIMEALALLTQAYISMCGISLGCRTVVYCAAEPWQERLAWLDLPLSEMARKGPFVHLMPHISNEYIPEEYDEYDITAMENEELLSVCNQMISNKEFDKTTLEVISWGILMAIEEEQELSKEIEATAPDGTLLKGVLKKQKCSSTWLIMTEPYTDLLASSCELVRDARELLLQAYSDYQRLHQLEGEIRALYLVYLEKLRKLEKDSPWEKHCVYMDVYSKLLDDLVLVQTNKLIEEWFGLKIY